jgi:hypothetical protein
MGTTSEPLILFIEQPETPELQQCWIREWLWKPNRELIALRQRENTFVKPNPKSPTTYPVSHFIRPHQEINMAADMGSVVFGRATVWDIENPDDGPGQQVRFIQREQGGKRVFADCRTNEPGMVDDAKLQEAIPRLKHGGYYDIAILWAGGRPREPDGYKNLWVNNPRFLAVK